MNTPHLLVHESRDSVGVAAVEGIEPGEELTGWVLDSDQTITAKALDSIPLGHKVALTDLADGATIVKYGHDIGRTAAAVRKGEHVHVHNARTKRW